MASELLPPLLPPGDPAGASGYGDHPPRMGFFTDTSVCIGCKACEVACKEWNHVPEDGLQFSGMSYDNTVGLGADTWRHVAFIEQPAGGYPPRTPRRPAHAGVNSYAGWRIRVGGWPQQTFAGRSCSNSVNTAILGSSQVMDVPTAS